MEKRPDRMEMGGPMELACRRIQQMEEEYDLLQYELDGWCVWPVLHQTIVRSIGNVAFVEKKEIEHWKLLAIAAREATKLLAPRRAQILVKTCSSARSEQEDSCYKDRFFDDLLLDIGDFFKLEQLNSRPFLPRRKAALVRSDLTSAPFDVPAGMLARVEIPRVVSRIASKFSAHLEGQPGLEGITSRKMAVLLGHYYWCKKLYGWLLDRVQPKYLLTADPGEFAITAAAKERGIRVVELQHGVVSRHDPAYSWTPYALKYKARMPIPDRIFLYGEYWQQELQSTGFWDEELRPVGSLRMDQYRKRREFNDNSGRRSVCMILVTTEGIDTDRLIAFITEFLELARRKLEVALVFKLHPIRETNKSRYVEAFQKRENVHVILGNEPPTTFQLLSKAEFHVSVSSACHYEALGLHVPTIILPLKLHELVLPLKETGYAFLARTPQDLLNIILKQRHRKVPHEVGGAFFAYAALENIKRELGV